MFGDTRCVRRAAVVHLNFRAGSTFLVPIWTVPSSMDRTSRCNKVDAVRLYASYRLNLLLLKGQRCVVNHTKCLVQMLNNLVVSPPLSASLPNSPPPSLFKLDDKYFTFVFRDLGCWGRGWGGRRLSKSENLNQYNLPLIVFILL